MLEHRDHIFRILILEALYQVFEANTIDGRYKPGRSFFYNKQDIGKLMSTHLRILPHVHSFLSIYCLGGISEETVLLNLNEYATFMTVVTFEIAYQNYKRRHFSEGCNFKRVFPFSYEIGKYIDIMLHTLYNRKTQRYLRELQLAMLKCYVS